MRGLHAGHPEGGERENIASALCRSRRAQAGSGGLPAACHPGSGSSRGAPVPDDDARIAGSSDGGSVSPVTPACLPFRRTVPISKFKVLHFRRTCRELSTALL